MREIRVSSQSHELISYGSEDVAWSPRIAATIVRAKLPFLEFVVALGPTRALDTFRVFRRRCETLRWNSSRTLWLYMRKRGTGWLTGSTEVDERMAVAGSCNLPRGRVILRV